MKGCFCLITDFSIRPSQVSMLMAPPGSVLDPCGCVLRAEVRALEVPKRRWTRSISESCEDQGVSINEVKVSKRIDGLDKHTRVKTTIVLCDSCDVIVEFGCVGLIGF